MKEYNFSSRHHLLKLLNRYLEAVISDAPELLPVSPDLRVTYNGLPISLGENEIWKSVIRFQSRQTFLDCHTQNIVFLGTATNDALLVDGSKPYPKKGQSVRAADHNRSTILWWYYVLRLCIREEKIAEIEEFTIPHNLINFDLHPKDFPLHNLAFDIPVPEEERMKRDEMIQVVETYWDGISKHIDWHDVLAHPDSQRVEMGILCTNAKRNYFTVQANFSNPQFYWEIQNRRYPVVDPIRGVVVSFVEFKQGRPDTPPGFIAGEVFKVEDGLFKDIYAFFKPMCTESGWKGVTKF